MSPIAVMSEAITVPSPSPKVLPTDIPRRPSPWHDVAHSLSTTSLPPRRPSVSLSSSTTSVNGTEPNTPPDVGSLAQSASSQALREWDERLSKPSSNISRHQLIPRQTKLAAERDKAGFIEYKLKLIDPTPERFERLITQLMWRLKQGRNEAIYELGLADDGTVIGLPRSQMDASLRTLELMASEVGATVIILKEIVLHSSRKSHPIPQKPSWPSIANVESNEVAKIKKSKWKEGAGSRRRQRYIPHEPGVYGGTTPKKLIFDPADMAGSSGISDEEDVTRQDPPSSDDDTSSPFFFERHKPDESITTDKHSAPTLSHHSRPSYTTRDHSPSRGGKPSPSPPSRPRSRKDEKKRGKSAAKSEARRLDLLRGDGTNPMWKEMHLDGQCTDTAATMVSNDTSCSETLLSLTANGNPASSPHFTIPHQPARPSSLRLTTPIQQESEPFLDDLLHLPLDSLSLSFADVRELSEPDSPISCTETESHTPIDQLHIDNESQQEGEEMICVEALVVRKLQHDEDGEDDQEDEEEIWGYGGEEDVWGFGGDD
ncbi:hypothetical protein L486_01673 [Kwoniella mangroviensis CBS 10435]|uniref:GTP binding protein 2 n=1 Tax=Kwoniella mangroviensis CBS 10435 TaxID=1331196 RepID=A0A1B9J2J4_9TREE|nr:uncharacterized protein I203_03661 [Kwoniella mangroviensis CBS 8507]OCF62007.1 hypothetical protein L486_01673 [Kwoniella mangroviensis CBS 10435]OCF66979.1 hypothetical protein I203_03661 [Kwoniella mangroviensis CBS 8507]OCF78026.1 hypothetical protein I204_02032 [Kwoniella mangroviensis CBS 8886]